MRGAIDCHSHTLDQNWLVTGHGPSARMVFTHIPKTAWTVQQLASSHFALFGRDVWGEVFVYNLGGQFGGSGCTCRNPRSRSRCIT
jgi:hypothetical protein